MISKGHSHIEKTVVLNDWPSINGFIKIGDNSFIMDYCVLHGHGGITIGNDVLIGPHTMIVAGSHIFENPNVLIRLQGEIYKGIVIEDDVWIGAHCSILDGVVIGEGSVIGANSLVNKSIPPYSVAYGNPCKIIRKRGSRL